MSNAGLGQVALCISKGNLASSDDRVDTGERSIKKKALSIHSIEFTEYRMLYLP